MKTARGAGRQYRATSSPSNQPRKNTPTSYIAKYISKNIDGRLGLAKEISKRNRLDHCGEHVSARASLHHVQRISLYSGASGIPRAALAGEPGGEVQAGAAVRYWISVWMRYWQLRMTGCFATYIMKQNGVLVPRGLHLMRTAGLTTGERLRRSGISYPWHLVPDCRGRQICTRCKGVGKFS